MFDTIDAAKKAAKRVQRLADEQGSPMKLSTAQRIVAAAARARDWHDLKNSIEGSCLPRDLGDLNAISAMMPVIKEHRVAIAPELMLERIRQSGSGKATDDELDAFLAKLPPSNLFDPDNTDHPGFAWLEIITNGYARHVEIPYDTAKLTLHIQDEIKADESEGLRIKSFSYRWTDGDTTLGQMYGTLYMPEYPLEAGEAAMMADAAEDTEMWSCLNIGRNKPDAFESGVCLVYSIEIAPSLRGNGWGSKLLRTGLADLKRRYRSIMTVALDPNGLTIGQNGVTARLARAAADRWTAMFTSDATQKAVGPRTVLLPFDNSRSGDLNASLYMLGALQMGADPEHVQIPGESELAEASFAYMESLFRDDPMPPEQGRRTPLANSEFDKWRSPMAVSMGMALDPPKDVFRHFPIEVRSIYVDMLPCRLEMDDKAMLNRMNGIMFSFANGTYLALNSREVAACGPGMFGPGIDVKRLNERPNQHMDMPYGDMIMMLGHNTNILFGYGDDDTCSRVTAGALLERTQQSEQSNILLLEKPADPRIDAIVTTLEERLQTTEDHVHELIREHARNVMDRGYMEMTLVDTEVDGLPAFRQQFNPTPWPEMVKLGTGYKHDPERLVPRNEMTFSDTWPFISPYQPQLDAGCPAHAGFIEWFGSIVINHARAQLTSILEETGPIVNAEKEGISVSAEDQSQLGYHSAFWKVWSSWERRFVNQYKKRSVQEVATSPNGR